jgi:hypothetical protein
LEAVFVPRQHSFSVWCVFRVIVTGDFHTEGVEQLLADPSWIDTLSNNAMIISLMPMACQGIFQHNRLIAEARGQNDVDYP